ncbi:heavy metal transporter [Streptomyces sp. NPDC058307]|uniref:heavy metal transporter n=1 Tax=Streptomyces sp. NPDC058307 TaxID=3346439 RepID=UPI0036E6CB16
MPEPLPPTRKRRGRLLRFGAALVVLCAVAGYLVVQYVTGGTGGPRCQVVSGSAGGPSYEFTPEQAVNAATITAVGTGRGLPERAVAIALATAIQESGLRNITHGDRDSLGLFQQRPSMGWGTPKEILDPTHAAGEFYKHLVKVDRYQDLPLTVAAQRVQRSGYPEAYAKHEPDAELLAAALTGTAAATLTCDGRQDTTQDAQAAATGTQAPATGPDAVRSALVRDFGRDALETTAAEVGGKASPSPTPTTGDERTVTLPVRKDTGPGSDRTLKERGWQLAHWAVANSSALRIERVSYAGRQWTAGSTESQWRTAGGEGGTGSVRIVTAR